VTAALLMAVGLSTAPAGATVTSVAKGRPAAAGAIPLALSTCDNGVNDAVNNNTTNVHFPGDEFYTLCKGSGPTSFRTMAYCANGKVALGVENADGSGVLSYASCQANSNNSTLNADWGLILCTNNNGTGTFTGYMDKGGDISWILLNWGGGTSIPNGGNILCDLSTSVATDINTSPTG